ncbi:MAG TPA: hypothetical protein VD864_02810, partial [Nocardioides sp.]|nr:hypothetical protein [Nocardioides sp.]
MGGRDRSHPRRASRLATWLPVALVLAVLAAAGVAWRLDPAAPDPAREPAAVAPPPGLALEAPPPPEPVAAVATGVPDAAKVRR